jgi:hypothetical protein
MERISQIRMELDINAQKLLQQVEIDNSDLEETIKAGIERGFKEIFEDDNIEKTIAELVKDEFKMTIKRSCNNWALKHKIQETISKNIEDKVDEVANEWSERILKNLNE